LPIIAIGAKTHNPYLTRILRARKFFLVTGIPIPPWEIDEIISEDWIDAIDEFAGFMLEGNKKKDNL
jgi:hypothetical protein